MTKYFFIITLILSPFVVFSQTTDEQLANYYFNEGDCEKALPYLEKVYATNQTDRIYNNYLSCLREKNEDKEILKVVLKQASIFPTVMKYQVAVGREYERQGDEQRARKAYMDLIEKIRPNAAEIINLQRAFMEIAKNDLALETLKKGEQILRGTYPLHLQYAEVYNATNETEKMIKSYIDVLDDFPNMLSTVKMIIPRTIDMEAEENERFNLFQNELIKKIQKQPNNRVFSDLLVWALAQRRNFSAALVHAKGLDKRGENNGKDVYPLGNQALQNKDFSTARNAFKYIIELGEDKPYYFASQQLLLNTGYQEIVTKRNFSQEKVNEIVSEYKQTLAKMPRSGLIIPILREMAYIQAYYGGQPEAAVHILDSALQLPRYNDTEAAKTKLLLADVYILLGEVWEASLYYMQVEKKFKYEALGEEAKYKNALVFYYDGDFKFAQSQLDILKEATTKLIANDAMKLSFLITDNLGLDSNHFTMQKFAQADLLLAQHQYEKAFQIYDSITDIFPFHKLTDDIYMRKAKAFQNQGKWEEAIGFLQKIVEEYGSDILADEALFQIAQIYENHLFDEEKSAEYYFRLMKDYPGSLFVTEARKSYRKIN